MTEKKALAVKLEHVSLRTRGKKSVQILSDISLDIRKGERWGIAGASGAGKSMTVYAMTALLPGSMDAEGRIVFGADPFGRNLLDIKRNERHRYCANKVSVILQDSIHALNPYERIDRQWIPTVRLHRPDMSAEEIGVHILERLERFGIAGGAEVLKKYPHQLSGGMRQRVAIAMALESGADILIADEPTTSLDAVNQRKVIAFLDEICRKNHLTLIYITHNLGIIESLCTHVAVLRDGRVEEQGRVADVFHHPANAYTAKLIAETARLYARRAKLPAAGETILSVSHVTKCFRRTGRRGETERFDAVRDVSFSMRRGEILGLLGESGCGKTTLARMILGLEKSDEESISYKGREIGSLGEKRFRPIRREIQMVFQDPFGSLDPRSRVHDLLMEPLAVWGIGSGKAERERMIREMCRECGLPDDTPDQYPTTFSGGQLQRIAIARALLVRPELLVADEIVSALDAAVQNQVLELLLRMKEKYGLTILFITHDLAVIRRISDRVMVMREGKIIASGTNDEILECAEDPYIRELRDASFILGVP